MGASARRDQRPFTTERQHVDEAVATRNTHGTTTVSPGFSTMFCCTFFCLTTSL